MMVTSEAKKSIISARELKNREDCELEKALDHSHEPR